LLRRCPFLTRHFSASAGNIGNEVQCMGGGHGHPNVNVEFRFRIVCRFLFGPSGTTSKYRLFLFPNIFLIPNYMSNRRGSKSHSYSLSFHTSILQ
jgi:hypothetical protein